MLKMFAYISMACCALYHPPGDVTKTAQATGKSTSSKLLFDGHSLENWIPEGEAKWRVAEGILIGDAGGDGWLRTNDVFKDFLLTLEFRNVPQGNSGIFFRAAAGVGVNPAPDHGYELQIHNEDDKYATGSIEDYIQRRKKVNPAPHQWHTYQLLVRGDHFTAKLDGVKVLDGRNRKFTSGHIGLQHHKDSPIEFRNIKLKNLTQ